MALGKTRSGFNRVLVSFGGAWVEFGKAWVLGVWVGIVKVGVGLVKVGGVFDWDCEGLDRVGVEFDEAWIDNIDSTTLVDADRLLK